MWRVVEIRIASRRFQLCVEMNDLDQGGALPKGAII
jgi:hypothetical protein